MRYLMFFQYQHTTQTPYTNSYLHFQVFLDDVGVLVAMVTITVIAIVVVLFKVVLFQPQVFYYLTNICIILVMIYIVKIVEWLTSSLIFVFLQDNEVFTTFSPIQQMESSKIKYTGNGFIPWSGWVRKGFLILLDPDTLITSTCAVVSKDWNVF